MKIKKQLLITTGGTGGHLYPAISFARKMQQAHPNISIGFVGGKLRAALQRDSAFSEFDYYEVPCAPFNFRNPKKIFLNSITNIKGIVRCWNLTRTLQPQVVVGFGCYHAFPLLTACRLKGIPYYLHEGNSVPGKLNRLFTSSAKLTACTFPQARLRIKGETCLSELFVRKEIQSLINAQNAYQYFGLDPSKKTLLFFGGSQGARSINKLAFDLQKTLPNDKYQSIIITGTGEYKIYQDKFKNEPRICIKEYETKMQLAYAIADLAFLRAGSSTICELIETKTTAVLIPYTYASDQHQLINAKYISSNGCGYLVEEKDLSIEKAVKIINNHFNSPIYNTFEEAFIKLQAQHSEPNLTKAVSSQLAKN